MRYYNGKRTISGKTKLIIFRAVFIIIAAIIIFSVTFMIGNRLKSKVLEAEKTDDKTHASTGLESERPLDENAAYSDYSPTVHGAGIKISDYTDGGQNGSETPKNIKEDVKRIAQSYDTLTIALSDENGSLIYTSEAMCGISHIPFGGQSEEEKLIRSALDEAKSSGLRTSAIILPILSETTVSGAAAVDSELIKELSRMGFDEVLFDLSGQFGDEISSDSASRIRSYVRDCSSLTDDVCKIGVMLSSDVYLNPSNAKQIQLVADVSAFIAIKFDLDEVYITTEAYNSASAAVTSLLGNFSVYNMRVIIDSRFDIISASVYEACTSHGVNNIAFLSYIPAENLSYSDAPAVSDSEDDKNTPDTPADNSNPYASTSDNPSVGAPADKDADPSSGEEDGDGSDHPWY